MANQPQNKIGNALLIIFSLLALLATVGWGGCNGSASIAAAATQPPSDTSSDVIQQSGTMYADQTWDILITTGISGGTYTFSFLPEFVKMDDQSGTNGIVHADPKGATGIYPFVIEVSNGTDSEMIRYTLTIISK